MPKHKSGAVLLPWMSANADNKERRFLQLGNSLLFSKKHQSLSGTAKHTYNCMAMESGGKREFIFPHAVAHKKFGIPGTTLDRNLKELITTGFIEIVQRGSLNYPSIYRFCFDWKDISASPNWGKAHKNNPQNGRIEVSQDKQGTPKMGIPVKNKAPNLSPKWGSIYNILPDTIGLITHCISSWQIKISFSEPPDY